MSPEFLIHLHSKDLPLLQKIQSFYGGIGTISILSGGQSATFAVRKLSDLVNVIIPHFKQYPLRSAKNIDFGLWVQCLELIARKEHLTELGLSKIIYLKSALNLGLSANLKAAFPHVGLMERPKYSAGEFPLDPNWISGFSEGDGSFYVSISPKTNSVRIFYKIELNERESPLISKIQEFFGNKGKVSYTVSNRAVIFTVVKLADLDNTIIPHFNKYLLYGNKLSNYLIWCEIVKLVAAGEHKRASGLEIIKNLKMKLNK